MVSLDTDTNHLKLNLLADQNCLICPFTSCNVCVMFQIVSYIYCIPAPQTTRESPLNFYLFYCEIETTAGVSLLLVSTLKHVK